MLRLAVVWTTVVAFGCVQDARFNPAGCDLHLEGDWTVLGEVPDATTCGTIDEVQLFIWNDEVTETWTTSKFLLLGCDPAENATEDGDPQFLDTTNIKGRCKKKGEGRLLKSAKEGVYKGQWVARDERDNILDCLPLVNLVATGDTIVLDTVNFDPEATAGMDPSSLDLCDP